MKFGNHCVVIEKCDGVIRDFPEGFFQSSVTLAKGANKNCPLWKNFTGTWEQVLTELGTFQQGRKDGEALLQGALFADGTRHAKNVLRNHIMMLDIDTGTTVDEAIERLWERGWCGLIWTTHSHRAVLTKIAESKFLPWVKKNKVATVTPEELNLAVIRYLREVKRYTDNILASAKFLKKAISDGGMQYEVAHDPLPKLRILLVLDEPYEFESTEQSQADRINGWKISYGAVSDLLGFAWDESCTDPSRLMYLPRVAKGTELGEGKAEIVLVAGEKISLRTALTARGAETPDNPFSAYAGAPSATKNGGEEGSKAVFATEGLTRFAAKYTDFDILRFMEERFEDSARGQRNGDRQAYACPNEDAHSKPDPNDQGFFVTSNGESWYCGCMHDSCKRASSEHSDKPDRLWFLDKLCEQAGITDAAELREYSAIVDGANAAKPSADEAVDKLREANASAIKTAASPETLKAAVEGLTRDASNAEVDAVFAALARCTDDLEVGKHILTLGTTFKKIWSPTELKKKLERTKKEIQRTADAQEGKDDDDTDLTAPEPPKDLSQIVPIWRAWGNKIGLEACQKQLANLNGGNPFLFRSQGVACVLASSRDGNGQKMMASALDTNGWAALLDERLTYKDMDRELGAPLDKPFPIRTANSMFHAKDLLLPKLDTITRVPVFAPNGELRTARGYDGQLQTYLDPQEEWEQVPDSVTPEHVERAKETLYELVRDVPFSDVYAGNEDKLIYEMRKNETTGVYEEVMGDDGWPLTNLERGHNSRLGFFAAILQTIARPLIDGSCPAYHIDKHAHGEGGTMLANMLSIIIDGSDASATMMPRHAEEVSKTITTLLIEGAPTVIFDNIPSGSLDSPEIAGALTAGTWKSRILGSNVSTRAPIRNVWLFCGVNVSPHAELARRFIPIKINSKSVNPAHRDADSFKHSPGEKFAKDYRKDLVWSCCVLIRNYLQRNKSLDQVKNKGTRVLNSFTEWSYVMGGIFREAGMGAFLTNIESYQCETVDATGDSSAAMLTIYQKFGEDEFTSAEGAAYLMAENEAGRVELPFNVRNESAASKLFGVWINAAAKGKTYEFEKGKVTTLISRKVNGALKYRLRTEVIP